MQDMQFRTNYQLAKAGTNALMRMEPLPLDLKVRCLFDEDLTTLIFPKVKEFLFRVNRQSPIEVAAKALAHKNDHAWEEYSFSYICNKTNVETKVTDLSTRFETMADGDELNLFYRFQKGTYR